MQSKAAVHPDGEADAEGVTVPIAPVPKSRKARKYVDRKAPKANFLQKVRTWRGVGCLSLRRLQLRATACVEGMHHRRWPTTPHSVLVQLW